MDTKRYISTLLLCLCLACSKEESSPEIVLLDTPNDIKVIDFGNSGSSGDIYVSFVGLNNDTNVQTYDLIVAKANSSDEMTLELASQLPSPNKLSIAKGDKEVSFQVTSSFLDADGDQIVNEQDYMIYIYTSSNSSGFSGSLSFGHPLRLADVPYYEVQSFIDVPIEAITYHPDGYIIGPSNGGISRVDIATKAVSRLDMNLPGPLGGSFDFDRNLYFSSMYNTGEIYQYDEHGVRSVYANGLSGPTGSVVDKDGNLFVNNYNNNTITKITPTGVKTQFATSSGLLQGPDGLIFHNDQLYCINFDDGRFMKVSENGEVSLFATIPGQLTGYVDIMDDKFIIPSLSTFKVYQVDLNGNVSVLAGSGTKSKTNGPAPLATFDTANGVAVAGDTIFIGDAQTIRMIIKHQ